MGPYRESKAQDPDNVEWAEDPTSAEVALFDAACCSFVSRSIEIHDDAGYIARANRAVEVASRIVSQRRKLLGRR